MTPEISTTDHARAARWHGHRRPQAANLSRPELARRQEAVRAARLEMANMLLELRVAAAALERICIEAEAMLRDLPLDVAGAEEISDCVRPAARTIENTYRHNYACHSDRASAKLPPPPAP